MEKFLIVVLAIVVSCAFVSNAEERCAPGDDNLITLYRNKLCLCHCAEDGKTRVCPPDSCLSEDRTSPPPKRLRKRAARCKHGDMFTGADGCSKCTCYYNHFIVCDVPKGCTRNPANSRVTRDVTTSLQVCTPKTYFRNENHCNWCHCNEDGTKATCMLKRCGRSPANKRVTRAVETREPEQKCIPNSTFMDEDDCNRCWCNEDGTDVTCTNMYCFKLDDIESHKRWGPIFSRK